MSRASRKHRRGQTGQPKTKGRGQRRLTSSRTRRNLTSPDSGDKPADKTDDRPRRSTGDRRRSRLRRRIRPACADTDEARPSKPDPAVAAAPKRTGQIAVFISRKDSKLYVRQNFAPLFDVPVTIAPSDRPLGTHVFTAQVDKNDANVLHWSVVSLPVAGRIRRAARRRRARLAPAQDRRARSR